MNNDPMTFLQPRIAGAFARRVLPLAVASCFALPAGANPGGASVVAGQAAFATDGRTLTVTNAPGTIINWQQFSIRPDEVTRFIQSGAASAVLNRVTGGDPSQILGQLTSNGRVFLINPAGIAIGAGATIDTAGFIASSLNISDADFLSGRMKFAGVGDAGKVSNHGTIRANGGPVYLIAPTVENHGVIRADNGDVLLAAGKRVEVVAGASPHLRVEIDNAEGAEALNVGELVGRHVSLYGTVLRNAGGINADRVSVTETGSIVLHAARDATLAAGSRITANGAGGGAVKVEAGGTLLVDGVVEARGTTGRGGDVQLLGERVGLVGAAAVDASGAAGGGTILAGGDYQGANAGIRNADATFVAAEATLRADATASGNGGRVIVWADDTTRYYGAASARGGAQGGDGGLIEVSGKQFLEFNGVADTRAPLGTTGMLLLDPSSINITTTADALAGGTFSGGQFGGATGTATLTWATIDAQLATNNVVITTGGAGGAGDITVVNASPVLNRGNDLWLVANRAINVNGAITNAGAGGLRLYAGWNGAAFAYPTAPTLAASTTADITVNAPISMVGGVLMAASDAVTIRRDIAVSGAGRGITLTANADNNTAGNLTIQSNGGANTAAVTTVDGAIALSGYDVGVLGGAAAGRNALVSAAGAGGTLDVRARRDLNIVGGGGGATATVQSAAAQTVAAGRNMQVTGGTSANSSGVLQVTADAAQTIDVAGNLTVRGSNTGGANDARGVIAGRGLQSIDVGGTFTIAGGTGAGTNKHGVVSNTPGAGGGATTIRAVAAFTETNPSATARAWLGAEGTGAFGDVDVNVSSAGTVTLTSSLSVGAGNGITLTGDAAYAAGALWGANQFYAGSPASAAVAANGSGNVAISAPVGATTIQTADGAITLAGVDIAVTGGAATGRSVLVDAQGAGGTLDVAARGNLTLTGGSVAGVTAAMQSAAAQNIAAAGAMTITAGNANGANATLAVTADAAQIIDVGGTLTVRANTGGTPTGSIGSIRGRGAQSIDANAIAITSGTGGSGNHALIDNAPGAGSGTTTLRARGNITETNNAGGRAFIGDVTGTLGNVSVDLQAGGSIGITSSLAVGGTASIAMAADAAFAAGDLWGANRFFSGSAQSAAVASNNAGNLTFTAPVGATTVQTTDGAMTLSGVNVSLTGGAAAGRSVLVSAQGANGTLDVLARHTTAGSAGDLTIAGGTAAGVTATLQSSGAQTLGATRDMNVVAGTAANTSATVQVTADAAQTIDVGRNLTVRGSNTANANNAQGAILGRGGQSIDVGGNVALAAGTGAGTGKHGNIANAPAGTGSTDIRVAGNFTETNNGAANRAWLGATGSGAFTNVAVNLQASGDITLANGMSTTGTNALSVRADQPLAAGELWGTNRFFTGSSASAATASNGLGGVFFASGTAATSIALATVSGPLAVISAARNAANSADVDVTLGTAVNQLALTSASGDIAVGDTAISGAGNRSFRNVTLANPVATAGSVTIEANNALTTNAFVTGNLGVTLAADADASAAGALALNAAVTSTTGNVALHGVGVTQAAATVVDAGTGTIAVDGNDGAIALNGTLSTVNGTSSAIVLRDATSATLGTISAVNGTLVLGEAGGDNLSGAVTQLAGRTITAAGLAGNVGGSVVLANAGNDFTGAAAMQAGGSVTLNDANALAVGAINAGGTVLATAGGTLTLSGNVTAAAAGDAVVLAAGAGASFQNSGANGISTPSGRWLIYSDNPAANAFGGLASGQQALWNRAYPAAVPEAGNRYVFATQPTATVTSTDVTKSYGTDATAVVAAAFNASGFVDASLYGNVFTQDTAANALTGTVTSAGSAPGASVAGGPYAINVAFAATTGYAVTNNSAGQLFVDPAALTVTANDAVKTYGQTTTFTGAEFAAAGLQNGETIGSVTLASAGAVPTASVAGSPYAITASNAAGGTFDPNNYAITYVDGQLTVNPAPLTVTANDAAKTYGQTVTFAGTEFTTSALQNGETVSAVTLASAGAPPTAGVGGSPYAIVASNATGGGTFAASNYAITYVDGQLTVNPASLTVTANDAAKTYGQTVTFAGTEFTASGLQNGETVGSVALASAGAAPTAGVAGSPYAITASGATGGTFNAANYTIGYADGQLTVAPATVTVTANDQSKVYGNTFVFTGSEFTPAGLQNGETIGSVTLTSAGTAATATVPGGPYAITPSVATGGTFDPANYTVAYAGGTMTVTPRPLAVAADNQTKVYGTADPALTYSAPGLVNGDTLAGALARAPGETVPGGPYAITQGTVTDANNPNYAIAFTNGALTITPAALNIAADSATRLYGDANPAFTATYTGLTNGDTPASIVGPTFATAATVASDVGSYAVTPLGAANPNYTITYTDGTLNITPAPLVITANDAARFFGQPNPPFSASYAGFRLGQGPGVLSGTLGFATAATPQSPPGAYAVAPSGVSSLNYAVTFVDGTLLVESTAPANAEAARDVALNRSAATPVLPRAAGGCATDEEQREVVALAPGLCVERGVVR